MRGKILTYWKSRRYGYIVPFEESTDDDYFFHRSDCSPDSEEPAKGKECEFTLGLYKGRTKAVRVRVLPEAEETHGELNARPSSFDGRSQKTLPRRAWSSDGGAE